MMGSITKSMRVGNNDIEDTVVVMPYRSDGDAEPARIFSVPHPIHGVWR